MPSEKGADLDWLTMRYVLGELSEDERAAFELRLGNDLSACEAVASAVRLCDCLRSAFRDTAPAPIMAEPRREVPRRGVLWSAIALVAGLVVALISRPTVLDRDHTARELVAAWRAESPVSELEIDESTVELPEANAADIPDWLIAGLSMEQPVLIDGVSEERKDN